MAYQEIRHHVVAAFLLAGLVRIRLHTQGGDDAYSIVHYVATVSNSSVG
jgi:hypothetical protein